MNFFTHFSLIKDVFHNFFLIFSFEIKNLFPLMQKTFTYLLILSTLSLIFSTTLSSQAQDNQRYMALSLVNVNYRDNQLEQIDRKSVV